MIKFFKKIRQKLLSENKFSKYLLYAIGEIFLVVIGILIALSIDNWNGNRIAYADSKNYLTEIVSDLQRDTISFKEGIEEIDQLIKDEEWVLNKENYAYQDVNRLWDCFSGWYMSYEINHRTFQKIQNEGGVKLIGFDELAEKINTYYTASKDRTESHTDWDKKEVLERQEYMGDLEDILEMSDYRLKKLGVGQIEKTFPMRQDSLTNAKLVIDFANSTRGRNHFKNNYFRHIRLQNCFKEILNEASTLLEEIEQELLK